MKQFGQLLCVLVVGLSFGTYAADVKPTTQATSNPQVRITTNAGIIEVELYPDKAPETVKNFLEHVDAGFYNGTVFHRVIPKFMIQGGGFTSMSQGATFEMNQKPTRPPIRNEADNGLKNLTGTVAMARTGDPHSASAQFFINTKDNDFLDHAGKTIQGWGYAVFGKVIKGMDVVRKIESTPTRTVSRFENVPTKDVVIISAERAGKK